MTMELQATSSKVQNLPPPRIMDPVFPSAAFYSLPALVLLHPLPWLCQRQINKLALDTITSLRYFHTCGLFVHWVIFIMKFEDFLMQQRRDKQKKIDLEEEVAILQAELDDELKLNRVLQCALHGPVVSRSSLSSLLPLQVQVLLAELAMVEEEIIFLERKVEELRLSLDEEMKLNRENQLQPPQQQQKHYWSGVASHREQEDKEQSLGPLHYKADFRGQRLIRERKASLGSASEIRAMSASRMNGEGYREADEVAEKSRCNGRNQTHNLLDEALVTEKPNRLSEELINCLIGIFLKLNKSSAHLNCEGSASIPKLSLPWINSKGQKSKTSFNSKAPTCFLDDNTSILNPYGILSDFDGPVRDVGPYKNFIQFTRNSVDMSRVSECLPAIGKMRILMHKLCTVDLTFLAYKQKLAFWINIYNACIMHAFLQHGLPSTPEKLLTLMNKAALNVGGIVLNALAIEHFILRHPCDSKKGSMDEKEVLLRHAYGLGYPEPNITFALCRGSWSSPPLRVYTAENVVNELGRAKAEYLEASVGVTSKKKIAVPKLLQWHMEDFADDMDSLLEWIYSQLPQSGPLKRSIMECLNGDGKCPAAKMVEIQPYESEFRYLLPL